MKVVVSGVPRGYQFPLPGGYWLQDSHKRQIQEVSPKIELVEMPQQDVHQIIGKVIGVEVLLCEGGNRIHYGNELDWEDYLKYFTPSLKWVMLCSTGFSDNITPEIIEGEVILTNSPDIHTVPISESVLTAMLDHVKNIKKRRENQKQHLWSQIKCKELYNETVLIIGLGNIGKRVAKLCKSFDMRVIGTKRRLEPIDNVDLIFPIEDLLEHLKEADYIVIAAPLTPETENMIGKNEFKVMKNSAYLINIGRGKIIDESAMIKALNEELIGGAYLDCHAEEPLPREHPLWDMENVLIIPNDSHSSPYIGDRIINIFCENLKRYIHGLPLLNVCDPIRGY